MKSLQFKLKTGESTDKTVAQLNDLKPNLILMFGSVDYFKEQGGARKIAGHFPNAAVIGCSTAGEIASDGVHDQSLVVTACHFDKPQFMMASAPVKNMAETHQAGLALGKQLKKEGLKSLFVLGKGLDINGSALLTGLREVLGPDVVITGGLAGDGGQFHQTFTMLGNQVSDTNVVALGIYGDNIKVAYGSMGGWEPFGPVRQVTKAKDNVLFALDGQPALQIYKTYLGEKAKDLPASGLLYPFAMLKDNQDVTGIIRTILAVNEADQSLTLAGDMPANGLVRLMHTNNEGLVGGARGAAKETMTHMKNQALNGVGILISCVGRKLVMGTDIEDELDAVREVLGASTLTGFYSYGEICPQAGFAECKLHNQTMTISYIYEV